MSNPVLDLQRLVASRQTISGRVVEILGDQVRVATQRGVVEVSGNGDLQVGDRVTIKDSKPTKSQGQFNASVFYV